MADLRVKVIPLNLALHLWKVWFFRCATTTTTKKRKKKKETRNNKSSSSIIFSPMYLNQIKKFCLLIRIHQQIFASNPVLYPSSPSGTPLKNNSFKFLKFAFLFGEGAGRCGEETNLMKIQLLLSVVCSPAGLCVPMGRSVAWRHKKLLWSRLVFRRLSINFIQTGKLN